MLRGILARRQLRSVARRGAATASKWWNDEWKRIGLKINAAPPDASLDRLAFVQLGFGVGLRVARNSATRVEGE